MSEVLEICKFGPITEAVLQPRALTICVGPQATGKSIAAQLLYFFRNLERLIIDEITPSAAPERPWSERIIERALETVTGNLWRAYVFDQAELTYIPDQEDRWKITLQSSSDHPVRIGMELADIVDQILEKTAGEKPVEPDFWEDIYIPAGRVLYSFVPPGSFIASTRIMRHSLGWPAYIRHFYASLQEGLKLWAERARFRSHADHRSPQEQGAVEHFLSQKCSALFQQGELLVDENRQVQFQVPNTASPLRIDTISAGQMEAWPFLVLASTLAVKRNNLFFIFEEPEAHLHPRAQIVIAETIAYLVNQGHRFLVTTHSPYILYTFNVLLKAYQVDQTGKKLSALSPESFLPPQSTIAYVFQQDGIVKSISDPKTGLIDEEELETAAAELGSYFEGLLDAEWETSD